MSRVVVVALVLALATACGSSGDDGSAARDRAAARAEASAEGRLLARPPGSPPKGDAPTGLRRLGSAAVYAPPGDRSRRLVVTLHGAGETPERAIALLRPYADANGLILLAPKSKGPTWDVAEGGFGPDVAAIDRLLERVFAEYTVDDVAVAGFSDGASYALSLGLTNGDLFRSVIGFSPGFIAVGQQNGMPRLFISHGTHDSVLPIGRTSRRGVPRLRAAGYRVEYVEFDGEHEVPPRIARKAIDWLAE